MITLPTCKCGHEANDHVLFVNTRCLTCSCQGYSEMEAYSRALILVEHMSMQQCLIEKLTIDRATAIELIGQIDDDEVVNMLIDGEFDHTPDPVLTALLLSDERTEVTVTEIMEHLR